MIHMLYTKLVSTRCTSLQHPTGSRTDSTAANYTCTPEFAVFTAQRARPSVIASTLMTHRFSAVFTTRLRVRVTAVTLLPKPTGDLIRLSLGSRAGVPRVWLLRRWCGRQMPRRWCHSLCFHLRWDHDGYRGPHRLLSSRNRIADNNAPRAMNDSVHDNA